jgi:methyl-accepting chemotaxis protein
MRKLFNFYYELSVKKKLISLFLFIAVIPLLLTSLIISYINEQALISSVNQNKLVLASGVAREVNETLSARSNALLMAAGSGEILSGDTARQVAALQNIVKHNPGIHSMGITDSAGIETLTTFGKLVNLGEREYFKQVKNGAPIAFSNVIRPQGFENGAIIAAVPIRDSQSKFLGIVVATLLLDTLSEQTDKNKTGNTGIIFMTDRTGKIVAHSDRSLLEQELLIPPVTAALDGQTGTVVYEEQGDKKIAGYSSIPLTGWTVVAQQSSGEAMTEATKARMISAGFTLCSVVLAVLVGFFAAGALTNPIRELVVATGLLAQGDLTARASATTKDELGQLAKSFNAMAVNLKEIISGVIGTADQVAASAEQLSATSSQAEQAVNQIAGTMTEFSQGSQKQTLEVNKTLQIVENLGKISQNIAEKAQQAKNLSSEMAMAAEGGGTAANNAVDKINEIREGTAVTSAVVTALGEKSAQIGHILEVISQIAGQTNLLALNAAIEAARAGEQGRGFAVVAEEVRKLAEQSEAAAQQIAVIIREIQTQTKEAIEAMKISNDKVNEGVTVVSTAEQALENILAKINNSVSMISDINVATNKQVEDMKIMGDSTNQVAVIARQTSAGAETTAAASEEVSASMEEIASSSQSLAQLASELQAMVAKFKI